MLRRAFLVAAVTALLVGSPAGARLADDTRRPPPAPGGGPIGTGLRDAVAAGRLSPVEATQYWRVVRRARAVRTLLPDSRRATLDAVVREVAAQARALDSARALLLFATLDENATQLAIADTPPHGTDVIGESGVPYRSWWGRGVQFHPLGVFGRLNAHVSAGREGATARLGSALAARAVRTSDGAVWPYYFAFGGGTPPWTSGMAQAVAAQSLARAGTLVGDRSLLRAARSAYRAISPRLVMNLHAGPWVRLYSFNDLVVLNAQLQAILSLSNYASLAGDTQAAELARRMERSAAAMLPRFDTGYWSLYSLGRESPLHYHRYVVTLLRALAARTGDDVWAAAARRFDGYTREAPIVRVARLQAVRAARAESSVSFSLSKPADVTFVAGRERHAERLPAGRHVFTWHPRANGVGRHAASLRAVDLAGNEATTSFMLVAEP